jgi:hypothetical protein
MVIGRRESQDNMLIDMIHGMIERRVLLNYRIHPDILQRTLPKPFRPKLYRGYGIGGVCMIHFTHLRPRNVPAWLGLESENAAHRIAVEWDQDGERREGVFIPRRDTNSWFNAAFGGRIFPGIFGRSQFEIGESASAVAIRIVHLDGEQGVAFAGSIAPALPATSIFPTIEAVAGFFALGATGYSATRSEGHYHGMELKCLNWAIEPLAIHRAESCFFDDLKRFPAGTVDLDCALLMRGIAHEWHSRPDLFLSSQVAGLTKHRC